MAKAWWIAIFLGVVAIGSVSWAGEPDWSEGTPDWSEGAPVPVGGRPNPFGFEEGEFRKIRSAGRLHTLHYPVEVTGILVPYEAVRNFLESPESNPLRRLLRKIFGKVTHYESMDEIFASIGLQSYPEIEEKDETSVYHVPLLDGAQPDYRMGVGLIERSYRVGLTRRNETAVGLTFSCAACHAANLFGKRVIGMTNRFPRSNEYFVHAVRGAPMLDDTVFRISTGASAAEAAMYREAKRSLRFTAPVKPLVRGLDTSLPQVARSLARRDDDEYATRRDWNATFPRRDRLDDVAADSKPAVWWNLKYKNRWLSDGSVVSGNPIFTNILWNEVGRGADLKRLERWLAENPRIIEELTTAVFSTEAPRYTDFFPASRVREDSARRGERVFVDRCARCHGSYEKAWSLPGSERLSWSDRMRTVEVRYPRETEVKDVGTDPLRWQGMTSLEKALNPLAISRSNGILIRAQKGYVPPPLVGIWARWPYFHNNSIPNLCALLTRGPDRPRTYWAGEANDPERDFDEDCNGYPLGHRAPEEWKKDPVFRYDTRRAGLGNLGHDERIFLENGRELLSAQDKRDLIQFLKTL